jgi:uncharacterized membrane protein YedE/YeeE
MSRVRGFGSFWWTFVIGDDWRLALGGGCALAATGVLATTSVPAWWTTPAIVIALLVGTLVRVRPRASSVPHPDAHCAARAGSENGRARTPGSP